MHTNGSSIQVLAGQTMTIKYWVKATSSGKILQFPVKQRPIRTSLKSFVAYLVVRYGS